MAQRGFVVDIQDIREEQDLRQWLAEQVNRWNEKNVDKIGHIWIEPAFGSSVGVSDAHLDFMGQTYGVELKHFKVEARGVHYKIRPVQRRYNVMGVRNGKRLLVLASVEWSDGNQLVMIRGDKVPLRDYEYMDGSGCEEGIQQTTIPINGMPFHFFMRTMTVSSWWPKPDDYNEGQRGLAVTPKQRREKL